MPSQTAAAAKARTPRPKLHVGGKVPTAAEPPAIAADVPSIVPSAPQLFPLIELLRAPENVRHVRVDEDVEPLAADIAAHGLLQSLIGYRRPATETLPPKVMIVGGGRRYQALMKLWEDGRLDGTFQVPVLIRDVEEAVELSLAENLQQRTMSAADEYLAFKALIDTGHYSPATLAARFGFSERVVKQRLRLADLAPEILEALAARRITIDAAYAYATTSDRRLQLDVFKIQDRKGWEPHRPGNIKSDISLKGMSTTDPIFIFIGADAYEGAGGGYEDDLFTDGADIQREGRALDKPFIARAVAEQLIDERAPALIEQLRRDPKLAPTIVGHVRPSNLRLYPYVTHDAKLQAPPGFAEVNKQHGDHDKAWKTVRNNGIDAHVVVGIDNNGCLTHYAQRFFVPKTQKDAVAPKTPARAAPEPTPEERAAQARQAGIVKWSRRLAIGPWAGTPLEGRAWWPSGYHDDQHDRVTRDGVKGWLVPVKVFVTDAQVEAQLAAAAARYDEEKSAADALQARRDQIRALEEEPAVIEINGAPAFRWADVSYRDRPEVEGEDAAELIAWRLYGLLTDARKIGADWPTLEAYRADREAQA